MNKKILILGVLGMCGMALAYFGTKKRKKPVKEEAESKADKAKTPEEIKREVMREMGRKGGQSKRKKPVEQPPAAEA